MAQFLLGDLEPLLYGNKLFYRDGVNVGYLEAGAYGFTSGGAVGMGFVENTEGASPDFINSGKYEIDIAEVRYSALASLKPFYGSEGEKVRSCSEQFEGKDQLRIQ